MKKIELLSPAGSIKNMQYAFAYGADAVYAGQPRYSLRVRNNEFNKLEKMAEAISMAHAQNKLFLVASNLFRWHFCPPLNYNYIPGFTGKRSASLRSSCSLDLCL